MLIKVILAERSGEEFTTYGVFRESLHTDFEILSFQTFSSLSVSLPIAFTAYRFWLLKYHNNLICITIFFTKKTHSWNSSRDKSTINPRCYTIGTYNILTRIESSKRRKSFLFVACTMSRIIRHETTGGLAAFSDLFGKACGTSMALPTDYAHAHFFPRR